MSRPNPFKRRPALPGLWLGLFGLISPALAQPAIKTPPARLVVLKVDGLSPQMLAAAAMPEHREFLDRLAYGSDFRKEIEEYERETGKRFVVPNIRRYFFQDGVVFDNMFAHTVTLSAISWAVVETGQPSIIKGHGTFSRDTCQMRSHLDGFRDAVDALKIRAPYGEGKTAALWNLDQIGVSLTSDAFDPLRVWLGPHIYRRTANRELLLEMGRRWLRADGHGFKDILHSHVSRLVTSIDYTEFNQDVNGYMTARKILERGYDGKERFDYLSPLFTLMDHQQHIDPHPKNMVHWLEKLDEQVGEIFEAVAQSERRDSTVVALVSDHGSNIQPGKVAYSYPMTRVFRTPLFGAHNVKTLLVETAWKAVSTPVPGIDFPRLYHSQYSPYGDGYVTAYIDPFGNARANVHLRNNDINRLHLLLIELKKSPSQERFAKIRGLFEATLERARKWLEPDLELMEDYLAGASDLSANLYQKTDRYSHDSAWRLKSEIEEMRPQVEPLRRLLSVRFDGGASSFDRLFSGDFDIESFIPKQYLGPANSVHQLSNYTIGIDSDLNWVQTTVDPQGNRVPMNYYRILSDYKVANAPANGDPNPYDLIVTRIPSPSVRNGLLEKGWIDADERLKNVVWLKTTAHDDPHKGGEGLIVEREDGNVLYAPIRGLVQDADGIATFQEADDVEPLALLKGRFDPGAGVPLLSWMRRFHPPREWMRAAYRSEYGIAVVTLLDILGNNSGPFIDSPEFQKYLIYFSSDEMKAKYLRGLKRKHAAKAPDFIVWAEQLWNFNSKARTSGGSHSGLRPIVSRTTFAVWGGDDTGIARGRLNPEVCTTRDIAPTLLRSIGMLDQSGRPIASHNAIPERVTHVLPGVVLEIWSNDLKRLTPAAETPLSEN